MRFAKMLAGAALAAACVGAPARAEVIATGTLAPLDFFTRNYVTVPSGTSLRFILTFSSAAPVELTGAFKAQGNYDSWRMVGGIPYVTGGIAFYECDFTGPCGRAFSGRVSEAGSVSMTFSPPADIGSPQDCVPGAGFCYTHYYDPTFILTMTNNGSAPIQWALSDDAAPAPEPGSWAMMLTGFGLLGSAMRTKRQPKHLPCA